MHSEKTKNTIKFEWDKGNETKSLITHKITIEETEEAFYDKNAFVDNDRLHSEEEARLILIGKTKKGKLLYIAFTVREGRIRPISSRPINRKEVQMYEKKVDNS